MTLGMPECVYALVQNTIYLALTSKSNECYLALNRARDVIQSNPLPPVPLHLRNSSTELQEKMGESHKKSKKLEKKSSKSVK